MFPHQTSKKIIKQRPVRRKHAMAGLYLSGFLDAKVPSKNRPFGPWKTWKTQWCMIRRSGAHLEIQIGSARGQITHQIQVPHDTVICRTESRSKPYAFGIFQYSDSKRSSRRASVYLAGHSETETQKWMGSMRDILRPPIHQVAENEFAVSLIDNEFSRAAGFSGLYGNLSNKNHQLIIRDPHTNQVKVSWHWNHLQKIQIFQSECTEDFQRTVTIKTNCEFPKGMGELRFFCLQGFDLYEALIQCQRSLSSTRLLTSPLPPIPTTPPATPPSRSLLMSRRMSRSENDLQRTFLQSSFLKQRSHGNSPARNGTCPEGLSSVGGINKSVSSLQLASPGVFMSTPGCSEPESLNDYDSIDRRLLRDKLNSLIIEEKEDTSSDERLSSNSSEEIYEEIRHQLPPDDETPPPLPPRPPKHQQFLSPNNMFTIGDVEMRKRSVSQPVSPVTSKKSNKHLDRADTISLSRYLPMNPSLGTKNKMTPLQQSYVYMANLNNTTKIIVSEPVPL
ncbi:uncharacterized protein LOC103507287 isoform X3 [Diaphorina citri]|uniref:Uncharacterized protein LOC103507287 isoform X3 n=1 Tax=Diaphorina citri TaxID=121845 RepID=A0A3Q0IUE7_DIACI|nr:uncharacterized protein LOC103507287 isoform X3 [Diaphorina citri]